MNNRSKNQTGRSRKNLASNNTTPKTKDQKMIGTNMTQKTIPSTQMTYSPEEMRAIIREAGIILKDFDKVLELLLFTGLRLGEATQLQFQDINFRTGILRVPTCPTKTESARCIPLNNRCIEILNYMSKHYSKPLPFTREQIVYKFSQILMRLRLNGRLHDLRKTTCQWLTSYAKLGAADLTYMLGHGLIRSRRTRRNGALEVQRAREAVQKLEAFLNQPKAGISCSSTSSKVRVLGGVITARPSYGQVVSTYVNGILKGSR